MTEQAHVRQDGYSYRRPYTRPDRLPAPGELYCFTQASHTLGGHQYDTGDTILLIELTTEAPHGFHCSVGNWKAKTKYGESIWTSIEEMITRGAFQLIPDRRRSLWDRIVDDEP